jgi:predicted enzyme related to lactoylglutathione lyase
MVTRMSDREGFPVGVPCWVTNLQPDPDGAARFYGDLFGWSYVDGGGFHVARMRERDVAAVAPQPSGMDPSQAAWITTVRTDSADEAARRAVEAGGSVLAEPFEGPSGRMTVIADPAGAVLSVCEQGPGGSAQVVNEPSAWAMSQLVTPDREGAKAFYGALFGWTTETFGPATMFRLPGYVGGEPEQPVSREVVAVMIEGEPARWAVDFWVHDVDETAAKALALDGRALVGPYDMPLGRQAVLADPGGASFSVTRVTARAGASAA